MRVFVACRSRWERLGWRSCCSCRWPWRAAFERSLAAIALGRDVDAVDVGSLDRRLPVRDLPIELVPFAERINGLLDRLQEGVTRERRFSDDVAHRLRTRRSPSCARCQTWPWPVSPAPARSIVKASRMPAPSRSRWNGWRSACWPSRAASRRQQRRRPRSICAPASVGTVPSWPSASWTGGSACRCKQPMEIRFRIPWGPGPRRIHPLGPVRQRSRVHVTGRTNRRLGQRRRRIGATDGDQRRCDPQRGGPAASLRALLAQESRPPGRCTQRARPRRRAEHGARDGRRPLRRSPQPDRIRLTFSLPSASAAVDGPATPARASPPAGRRA